MWRRRDERLKEHSRGVKSGCVKRSVKRRRWGKGKEWKEGRDAWKEISV